MEHSDTIPVVNSSLSVVTSGPKKKAFGGQLEACKPVSMEAELKNEDLHIAMMLFNPGEWMLAFDLSLAINIL